MVKRTKNRRKKGKGLPTTKISSTNSDFTVSIPLPPSLPNTVVSILSDKTITPLTEKSLTLKAKSLKRKKTLKTQFKKENMKRILQSFPKYKLNFKNESTHATIKDESFIRYLKELIPTITETNTWYKKNERKCIEYDAKNQKTRRKPKCKNYEDWISSNSKLLFDTSKKIRFTNKFPPNKLNAPIAFTRYISDLNENDTNIIDKIKSNNFIVSFTSNSTLFKKSSLTKTNETNETKNILLNLSPEESHSFDYFLITARCAPTLIKNFYNKVYIDNQIFSILKTDYKLYDMENLAFKYKADKRLPKSPMKNAQVMDFFNTYNFNKNDKYFKVYVMKNSKMFESLMKKQKFSEEYYSIDIFKDIRGKTDGKIEIIQCDKGDTKLLKYKYISKGAQRHILSISNIENFDSNYDSLEEISISDKSKAFLKGNMNILVRRNNNIVESVVIQIPSLTKDGHFVSHGLDDLLLKFLKNLLDSFIVEMKQIVQLEGIAYNKTKTKKLKTTKSGIVSGNKALTSEYNNDFENSDYLFRRFSEHTTVLP